MLKVSAKTQYGLRALLFLARERERERCTLQSIAKGVGVTTPFLEQILVVLRRAGIIRVYRGSQGGYALAQAPEEITALQVYEALEGDLRLLEKKEKNEVLAGLWEETERALTGLLRVSLQELLLRDEVMRRTINYSI